MSIEILRELKSINDILKFSSELQIITIGTIAGIISFKFVSRIYEELYEPIIHSFIPDEYCLKISSNGPFSIKYGIIIREFIKWIILIILLILIHLFFKNIQSKK